MTLSTADLSALQALARGALEARLSGAAPPPLPTTGPLAAPGGAFVTVRAAGRLRARVGRLAPDAPLGATVAALAAAAADHDPRFAPLTAADAAALEVSVAAIGPLAPLADPAALDPGRHGLAVTRGLHRGVLLPADAAGRAADGAALLRHACLAAGLPPGAHAEPGVTVEVFEVAALPPAGEIA